MGDWTVLEFSRYARDRALRVAGALDVYQSGAAIPTITAMQVIRDDHFAKYDAWLYYAEGEGWNVGAGGPQATILYNEHRIVYVTLYQRWQEKYDALGKIFDENVRLLIQSNLERIKGIESSAGGTVVGTLTEKAGDVASSAYAGLSALGTTAKAYAAGAGAAIEKFGDKIKDALPELKTPIIVVAIVTGVLLLTAVGVGVAVGVR